VSLPAPRLSVSPVAADGTGGEDHSGLLEVSRQALLIPLAQLVSATRWATLPAEVQDRARDRLLDALSTAIASRDVDVTRTAVALPAAPGLCTVLPTGAQASPRDAAFANGVAVHAVLFEDINLASVDHPGAVVVPAALAAAEATPSATISDLLAAIVAGYEVQLALGAIAAPGVVARGFRTTSVFGSVGAAAAAAHVWGQEPATALALGANFAGGIIEAWSHGTMEPYLQAGWAAANGLLAAELAQAGALTAAPTFEGPNGYLRAFADVTAEVTLVPDRRIMDVSCKPYPISGAKLSVVDSALAARSQGLDATRIVGVVVRVPPVAKDYPGGDRKGPFATMPQAQDSTQFCVAAALLGRSMTAVRTFTHGFADPDVSDLTQVIEIVGEPGRGIARVEIALDDGTRIDGEIDGRAGHVPSVAKMAAKLRELTAGHWTPETADAVVGLVCGSPDTPVAELSARLRR
jgi:2-methylcitrate dehydratase PrpD